MVGAIGRASFALSVLIVLGIVLPNHAQTAVFNPKSFTLENGMQVVLIENHRAPIVSHMVWYKVGAADESPGKSGIAHFLEHLMFKGTPRFPNGSFSTIVARNGGEENAFTSYDYTGYYQTVSKDRLPIVMDMEADRMTNLVLSDDDIEIERAVVLEERRSRTERNPSAILSEQANAALYLNYPYRRPIIGWEHEIRSLKRNAIMAFYKHWYAPNNAILIVAGDITISELRPLVKKYYGPIPRGNELLRVRPKEPPQRATRTVTYRDARVRQPSWRRMYLAPSFTSGRTEHAYALEILSDILGGSTTSRLYHELVIKQKIAISAGTHYNPSYFGPSKFLIYVSPAPGFTMFNIKTAVDGVIDKFLAEGSTTEEIMRSKNLMKASAIYARDSFSNGARILGSALTSGQTIADVEAWPDRISNTTIDDVNAAAAYIFSEIKPVTAHLLPEIK